MTNAHLVVSRWLVEAGLFEAPPVMVQEISEWVVSQAASVQLQAARANLGRAREFAETRERDVWQGLEAAMADLRNSMTPKGASRALFDAYKRVALGLRYMIGGFSEAKAGEFQKLTPESRAKLYEFLEGVLQLAERELAEDKKRTLDSLAANERQSEQVERQAHGKVWQGTGKSVSQKFPVNLTGWKYHPKNLQDLIAKRIEDQTGMMRSQAEKAGRADSPEFRALMQDIIEGMNSRFGSVWVVFEKDADGKSGGHWSEALNRITIKMPLLVSRQLWPKTTREITEAVRHELQHFSQSYMKELFALADHAGKPSRAIQTPSFNQHRNREVGLDRSEAHALDDIEFYTDLTDAIDRLKGWLEENPLSSADRAEAVKKFVGLPSSSRSVAYVVKDWFFAALQKNAPGKYRKAVGELTKAVL